METFVNDTPRITIDTNIDLSGYSTLLIKYKKPDGTTGCWTATICPTDNNCMYYDIALGELDQEGHWLVQGIAKDVGVQLTGRWCKFNVHEALAPTCTTAAPTTVPPTTAAP